MKSSMISKKNKASVCAALILAAGTATTASAIDRHWTCNTNNTAWTTAGCWSPVGVPAPGDNVNIGNVAGVQNTTILLNINDTVNDINITDGMTLDTNSSILHVNLSIEISGRNAVGPNNFPSRLVVDQIVAGDEVFTQSLYVHDRGEVLLVGGGLSIDSYFNMGADSFLRGAGTATFESDSINFRNDGVIAPTGAMTFYQSGSGHYDLDGNSGSGDIDLTSVSNSSLTLNGDGLSEAFGGSLSMIRSTLLHMNLAEPWSVASSGSFNIYGAGGVGSSRVTGAPINFNGTINLYSSSLFSLQADVTFGVNSELVTGLNALATVTGDAVLNGGLFIINEDSNLDFDGATEVRGGSFVTHSIDAASGSVDFNGPTEWSGNISIAGVVRQNGPAHVTGPSTVTGDTLDMDGSNDADWEIDSNLILNVARLDFSGSAFNNTLDIANPGRINVHLVDPNEAWILAGTMNLVGNTLAFSTRVGDGSPLYVTGDVNVSGKNDIASPAIIFSESTLNIPGLASSLRFMSTSLIGANVTFTGDGVLQNGGNGVMTLNSGLNTGAVGLYNAGTLRVGAGAGIISVDRFLTSGTWAVQIGGHNAGDDYDRLVSNGTAQLSGTLQVDLIDDELGSTFQPAVGDEFTILNAVGGVTGAFAPNVISTVGTTVYHWSVIIGSADVVLRLDSIETACRADFNADGFVNSQDFFDFLTAFFAAAPSADFNDNGFIDSQDFFDFLTAFFSPC